MPIPKGFYYVTGTKNTGIVISDDRLDENNATGNNGNQFVWVPVQTNPKLKIIVDGQKTISKVTIIDWEQNIEEIAVNETEFEKIIMPTTNTPIEIIVDYVDGSQYHDIYWFNSIYEKIDISNTTIKWFFGLYYIDGNLDLDETIKKLRRSNERKQSGHYL